MYSIPYFREEDESKVIAFMQENSFAIIMGFDIAYPVATHVPLEISKQANGKIILSGHMMKKTDHQLAFEKNNNVLVIFNGPHCYVSASWYSNPQTASTWNYMTVHARGKIFFSDAEGTYEAVKNITEKYEGKESLAAFHQLPENYIAPMLRAIIGFTIEVEDMDNVFKLSQNRDEVSKRNIIEQLTKRGDENSVAIAKEMEKRI